MRQAAAVLDAHGAPLSLEAVETVLGRLMPHRFLLRWETAHAWRTTLVRLGDDGVLTLDRTTPDLVAMRRAIRKLARTTIVQRTRDEHFARVHAQSMTILAEEGRRDAEAATRLRRAVLRVVPEPGAPRAVALLDVAARTVRTFVGAEVVLDLSGSLGDFDLLAGLHIRETLAALGLDAEAWRLVDLRPPRRTRRLNRRCAIVARMAGPKRRATYEDLMQVPDTKVAEIIDGELIVSPRPASPHAHAASVLGGELLGAFHRGAGDPAGPGGWWILLEPEMHLGDDVLVPDWAGWRRERMPIFPDTPAFTLAPDWVCEVISPSTGRIDRSRKMRIYAREGVSHLWFVEPLLETLEIYRLEAGRWVVVGTQASDDVVRAEPFDAVELRLGRWWMPRQPAG